jgi:hypothetical protein
VDFGLRKHEKHALIGTERSAKHESLRARLERVSYLGSNEMNSGGKLHCRHLGERNVRDQGARGYARCEEPLCCNVWGHVGEK